MESPQREPKDLDSASEKTRVDVLNVDPEAPPLPKPEMSNLLEAEWAKDPDNPLNWTRRRKIVATAVVASYSIAAPLSSTIMAPGLNLIAQQYNESNGTILALTLCTFVLSFGLGCLFWAPVTEMYGRTLSLHIANIGTCVFNVVCGYAPNVNTLIGVRFIVGFFASAPMSIGGGSIADLYEPKDRAGAMSFYALGLLIGPVIGPIIGGYSAEAWGMRYVFILMGGLCALCSVVGIPFLAETYAPVILQKKAKKAGRTEEFYALYPEFGEMKEHPARNFWENIQRPTALLFQSMILFMLTLYMAFLFGLNYLMFATFPAVFAAKYNFNTGSVGLAYLGIGVGCILAAMVSSKLADNLYHRLGQRDGLNKPEHRLPFLILGSFVPPIGLFWYGWSADAGIHWIMPIIGTGIFGFGMLTAWLPIQLYVVDAFQYAASASSALAVFRSLLGFVFPLFAQDMFDVLGLGGGNSLLAGLSIVIGIPFPIWLWYKGEEMRKRNKHTRWLTDKQSESS